MGFYKDVAHEGGQYPSLQYKSPIMRCTGLEIGLAKECLAENKHQMENMDTSVMPAKTNRIPKSWILWLTHFQTLYASSCCRAAIPTYFWGAQGSCKVKPHKIHRKGSVTYIYAANWASIRSELQTRGKPLHHTAAEICNVMSPAGSFNWLVLFEDPQGDEAWLINTAGQLCALGPYNRPNLAGLWAWQMDTQEMTSLVIWNFLRFPALSSPDVVITM